MADSELASITEDTTPDLTDMLYLVDSGGTTDKRTSVKDLAAATSVKVRPAQSATERSWGNPGVTFLASGSNVSRSQNFTYYEPFVVDTPLELNEVALEVTTAGAASSVISLALLNADLDWQPSSLLVALGTVSAVGNGVKSITGLTQAVPAGRYLWGYRTNSSSVVSQRQFLGMLPGLGIRSTFGATPNLTNMFVAETYSATWTSPTDWDSVTYASGYFHYAILGRWT